MVFLNTLRADWRRLPGGAELEAMVEGSKRDNILPDAWALEAIRATTLKMAQLIPAAPDWLPLFRRAIQCYTGRPIREWDEVLWVLDIALASPSDSARLLRTLVVSVRLGIKGDVPFLANLGSRGDATHEVLPTITRKLGSLFESRGKLGNVLFRQLVKTLPHVGASFSELDDVRGAPEGLQYLLECPLTTDIREEIHSHASPANLTLVRAYLRYLEKGDQSGLEEIWMAQKIPEHDEKLMASDDPAALKLKLIEYAREMDAILTRIYAFDPESPESVLADIVLWLKAAGRNAPQEASTLVEQCRSGETRSAVVTLLSVREGLAATIASSQPETGLQLLYLDLELEKLGYLLFGELVNTTIPSITAESLPNVIDVMRAMMLSESMKGWDSPKLAWLARALKELPGDTTSKMAQLMVLDHQINDEIARIGMLQYQGYADIIRQILIACKMPYVEQEVNRFVDGLTRGTTLQHIGELGLRIYHYVLDSLETGGDGASAEIRARVEQYHRKFESEAARLAAAAKQAESPVPMWIYRFQTGQPAEPDQSASVLGGKGANLCIMCALDMPVPPGFVISVGACERYMSIHALDPSVHEEINEATTWLEQATGRKFGDPQRPLLVSVRSGAPVSMPGMLDTILNVGMTDNVARAMAEELSDESAALDSYIHFLLGYAKSVLSLEGLPVHLRGVHTWEAVTQIKHRILAAGLEPFWESTKEQIVSAVEAVFRSWNNPHAVLFRKMNSMPAIGCTAATVQQMVFGNADTRSCTGVVLTRNPVTDAHELYGEYLPRAHGEDLVAGLWTPLPIQPTATQPGRSLTETMPDIVSQLRRFGDILERRFGEPQDIEFTVQRGKLYLLQTRSLRARTGVVVSASGEATGSHAPFAAAPPRYRIIARGLGASPGAIVGRIAMTSESARRMSEAGTDVILVRATTTPEDLAGMAVSGGVLTQRGGVTSHAANNARYLGKPCVVGCVSLVIDEQTGMVALGSTRLHEGDTIFIDGMTGEVGVPVET